MSLAITNQNRSKIEDLEFNEERVEKVLEECFPKLSIIVRTVSDYLFATPSITSSEKALDEEELYGLFFKTHEPILQKTLDEALPMPRAILSTILVKFLIRNDAFDAEKWKTYFYADVGAVPMLPTSIYSLLASDDPLIQGKKNYQTHFPPVLRPRTVIRLNSSRKKETPYSLHTSIKLAEHPREGSPATAYGGLFAEPIGNVFSQQSFRRRNHPIETQAAGKAEWLLMRKDVVAPGQSYKDQIGFMKNRAKIYEPEPQLINIVTVLYSLHVVNGDRHFGDISGKEGRMTYSRCKEKITEFFSTKDIIIGNFSKLPEKGSVLYFEDNNDKSHKAIGLAGIKILRDPS